MARKIEEWIAKHDDQAIPTRVKVRIVERQSGRCAECSREFDYKLKAEFDHERALVLGGEHRESNIRALCGPCHKPKTRSDIALRTAEKTHVRKKALKREKKSWRPKGYRYNWQTGRYERDE
jgi:5-methylcytosine-specific restriction endonuclease McrA